MSVEKKIVIKADIEASLKGMDTVVSELETGLKKQKYDFSKNTGLAKLIKQYRDAKEEFDTLVGSGSVDADLSAKAVKAGEKTVALYKQIGQSIKKLQGDNTDILKAVFPENFSAKVDKGAAAIDHFFKKLSDKQLKEATVANLVNDFARLQTELSELQNRRVKFEVEADTDKVRKELTELTELRDQLIQQVGAKLAQEPQDSTGKTRTKQLTESRSEAERRWTTAKNRRASIRNTGARQLTDEEREQIQAIEEEYRGADFRAEEAAASRTLRRYINERATRTSRRETGEGTGRRRSALSQMSDDELEEQIEEAQERVEQLRRRKEQSQARAEQVRQRPATEYRQARIRAEEEERAAKAELDATEEALRQHASVRKQQLEVAKQQTEQFARGESPAGVDPEDVQSLKEYNEEIQKTREELKKLGQEKTFSTQSDKDNRVAAKESEIAAKEIQIQKIRNDLDEIAKSTNIEEVFNKLEQLNISTDGIERTEQGLANFRKELKNLDSKTVKKVREALIQMGLSADQADKEVEELSKGILEIKDSASSIKQAESEMESLKNQFLQFFSITNSIQLFKRTVQDAVNTIKELDAVMTETATVTDFSVGDMWEKLPEYAAGASRLGASITDLYSATTLYYQQGLQTNKAMAVGTETIKMARIANMDAAQATQAMTAALRGFNMEIGEMDAQKVNDVYSKLAAITAADTSQIATAMTKTASIAAGANMEFETTAALLAQIIETTQEAPETAGTAMKTIVARFSEVKTLKDKGQVTGTDEEGEEINVNNIDKALRSVGISMAGFFEGTEGLDSVLLKLAEKWNTLDFTTQRYIATTAAGSRQQSRFIAMMSDYERTMELVGAANDSAGASQQQFEKTLESLDAKTAKLSNAWKTFTMGLANDEVVKGVVDFLTKVLETINKIIDSISGGSGLRKSIISLVTAFATLKVGRNILGSLFETARQAATGGGAISGQAFIQNFKKVLAEKNQAKGGGFFKNLFPKKEQWTQLINKPFGEAIKNIDFSRMGSKQKQRLVDSILGDFDTAIADKDKATIPTDAPDGTKTIYKKDYRKEAEALFAEGKIEEGTAKLQEYADAVDETGKSFVVSEQSAKKMNASILSGTAKATAAAAGLAAAFTAVGAILDKNGNKKGAEVFSVLATGATALAAILGILPGLFQAIGISISSIPIIGWIAAIVSALISLVVIIEKLHESPAEKLERLTELSKKAAEAAKEATSAYKELLDTKGEYDDVQAGLEELIRGTDEWREKLVEANNQVLELLTTYPMLADYIARGEDGQLTIKEEGWNRLIELKQQQATDSYAAAFGADILRTTQEQENAQRSFSDKMNRTTANGEIILMSDAIKQQVYNAWQESPDIFTDEGNVELEALARTTGYTTYELVNMVEAMKDYQTAMQETSELLKTQNIAYLSNLSEEVADSKYTEVVSAGLAERFGGDLGQRIEGRSSEYYTSNGKVEEEIVTMAEKMSGQLKYRDIVTDTSGGLETYRQVYQALTGNEADENWTEEDLANQIASIKISEEQIKTTEKLITSLDNLATKNKSEANYIASLLSGDISKIGTKTVKDLETFLSGRKIEDVVKNLGYSNKEDFLADTGYTEKTLVDLSYEDQVAYAKEQLRKTGNMNPTQGNINSFLTDNQNAVITAEMQFNIDQQQLVQQAREKMDKAFSQVSKSTGFSREQVTNVLGNQQLSVIENIGTQVSNMGREAAQKYLTEWKRVVDDSNLNGDTAEKMANYLSTVDWSSMTQAVEAMDYMQTAGVETSAIAEYWKVATQGSHTYITSLQEVLNLTARMQKKALDANELEDRLSEGKGTNEDIEALVRAGASADDFQLTPEGWYATTEAVEEAVKKLKQYNAEDARAVAEQQRREGEWATGVYENTNKGNFLHYLTTEDEDGKKTAGTITQTYQAMEIASLLGESQQGEKEDDEAFIARIQEAYGNFINLLNNKEMYQVVTDKTAAMTEASRYTAAENKGRVYQNEAEPYNPLNEPRELTDTDKESIIYSAQTEAKEAGIDVDEMMAYADALMTANAQLENNKMSATQIALANYKMNTGLGEIVESYDDWTGLIDENTGLIKASASSDVAAYNKLKASVNKMLNTSEDLSEAFWGNAENMKNLKKAAEGDTEALEALQKAAASDYLTNIDFGLQTDEEVAKGAVQDFVDYMNEVDIPKLEAGVEWSGDDAQQFIDNFNAMAQASNMSAEQIQESVQAMGFDAKIKMIKEKRQVPVYKTESWQETVGNKTITHSGAPVIEKYEEVEGFFPVVETITASGAGGGGVTTENISGGKANADKGKKGGSNKKDWENPYDKHYNTLQEINEALRERERLERRYQRLLEQSDVKGGELVKNAEQQIEKAENEIELNKKLNSQRAQQIQEEIDEKGLGKYYSVIENEYGEYEIRIDWEAINAVKDEEEGQKIEDSLGDVERWSNDINEGNDTIEDIRDNTQEIRNQGEDEYFELETRIKDALVQAQQDEIDKLSEINTSINDTNARLLETMQYNLEQERQMRENDKTEQELEDKQRRLEYLSQDTSGANALEIMQLQKEIDEGRESYTDTLIDQKISELQHQNDEAAEQRQRQIDIAESQLDHYVKTGEVWSNVYSLMEKGIGTDGVIPGSELEKLLKNNDNWDGKSGMEQLKWNKDLSKDVALAIQYLKVGNSTESLIKSKNLKVGESITFTTSDNTTLSGKVMENGDVVADGKTYTGIYRTSDNKWLTDEAYQGKNTEPPQSETSPQTETPTQTEEKKEIKVGGKINAKGAKIYKSYDDNNGKNQHFGDDPVYNVLEEKNGRVRVRHHSQDSGTTGWFKKSAVKAYKTGGLADYTGPAWLDGTKSKPELVLNAQDTQNFIQLKNVLASLMSGTGKSSENIGDSTYDIDINVESIGSDYDVEQMAEKIKNLINQDARYRNNNTVSLTR